MSVCVSPFPATSCFPAYIP